MTGADAPSTIDTGISQALVAFPEAGLLGMVTVFAATVASGVTVVPQPVKIRQ